MASIAEIVSRARTIAESRGIDPHQSPVADNGMAAEALVPHAIRFVFEKARATGALGDFQRVHEIEIEDGIGALPSAVDRESLDSSYILGVPRSAYLRDAADYERSRFDNLLCYYTAVGNEIRYSCDVVGPLLAEMMCSAAVAFAVVDTEDPVVDGSYIGNRFVLDSRDTGLIVDAFVDDVTDADRFTLRGKCLGDTASLFYLGQLYDSRYYALDRTISDLETNTDNNLVESPTANFTIADEGKRITATHLGSTVVDTVIKEYKSPTVVSLGARPLSSQNPAQTANILVPALPLVAAAMPVVPSDSATAFDLPEKVLADVILVVAGALAGDMTISQLLTPGAE